MNILELFAHIGLKADTKPANEFLKAITSTQKQLKNVIAKTFSFTVAIKAMNDAFNDALSLTKFEQATGESSQEMQKWVQIANQVNGAGQSVAASIDAIAANQEKIKFGQGNISGYQLLGIDPKSNPIKVLEEIRLKTAGLSNEMRRNIAQQFGVSRELVATLELTNQQFKQMGKNTFIIPESAIRQLMKTRASLVILQKRIKYLVDMFVAKVTPTIEKIIQWIEKGITTFSNAARELNTIIQYTIGWKKALLGLIAVFALFNFKKIFLSPIGLITLAFIGLILVLDDIYGYFHGKDSVFGDLIKKYPDLLDFMDKLKTAFQWISDLLSGIIDIIKFFFTGNTSHFDDMVSKWEKWGGILKTVAGWLQNIKNIMVYFQHHNIFGKETNTKDLNERENIDKRIRNGTATSQDYKKRNEIWEENEGQNVFANLFSQFSKMWGDFVKSKIRNTSSITNNRNTSSIINNRNNSTTNNNRNNSTTNNKQSANSNTYSITVNVSGDVSKSQGQRIGNAIQEGLENANTNQEWNYEEE